LRFIHNWVIAGIPWMVSFPPPPPPHPMWYLVGIWQVPTGILFYFIFIFKSGGAFPKIEHPPHNNDTQSILENRTPSIQLCRKHSSIQWYKEHSIFSNIFSKCSVVIFSFIRWPQNTLLRKTGKALLPPITLIFFWEIFYV